MSNLDKFLRFFFVGAVIIAIAVAQEYLSRYSHLSNDIATILSILIAGIGLFACLKVLPAKQE